MGWEIKRGQKTPLSYTTWDGMGIGTQNPSDAEPCPTVAEFMVTRGHWLGLNRNFLNLGRIDKKNRRVGN